MLRNGLQHEPVGTKPRRSALESIGGSKELAPPTTRRTPYGSRRKQVAAIAPALDGLAQAPVEADKDRFLTHSNNTDSYAAWLPTWA